MAYCPWGYLYTGLGSFYLYKDLEPHTFERHEFTTEKIISTLTPEDDDYSINCEDIMTDVCDSAIML